MKNFPKNKILRVLIWVITLVWMAGIFYMSSRPVEVSRQDSAWVMEKLNIADSKEAANDTNNAKMMNLQTYIRKKAHVVLYAGLAILMFLSLYGYVGKSEKTALASLLLSTLYGATDEFHQIFTHRGAQFPDVLVDARGAVWGLMCIMVVFIIIENSPRVKSLIEPIYQLDIKRLENDVK
jgi:VanZ family protein